jgi:hypothetical protein
VALHAGAPPEEPELLVLALAAAASVLPAPPDGVELVDGAGAAAVVPLDEPALTGFADVVPLESAALSNELPPQALKVREVATTTAPSNAEGL